jgi:hypothetical protein
MATLLDRQVVDIAGSDAQLVARLSEPLRRALAGRCAWYGVHIEPFGRTGSVMVRINGPDGHLGLLLGTADLEPQRLVSRVRDAVRRLDL